MEVICRPENFGILTELYAYVTFLLIILTYGTETGYFRFANEDKGDRVYSSLIICLFCTSLLFIAGVVLFQKGIAKALSYEGQEIYIVIMGIIVGIDAFTTIPFARLRKEEKSRKFALIKIINVVVTIGSVLFFYEVVPRIGDSIKIIHFSVRRDDVVYVFISNLIASGTVLLLLTKEIFSIRLIMDKAVLKKVLEFSFPLLVAGLAGTINEALDRVLLKHMIPDKGEALYILGIYGANYRVAMLLSIFVQMFRYAVEPFYFNYYGKSDEKEVFARIMRLFIGVMIVLTMIVLFYLHYIKYFIDTEYHKGLNVVPVVLCAFIFYGIFYNQSIWYKLTKKTGYAILLTLSGASITIIANVFFVQRFSYMAAAYGHFFAYFVMMVLSYFIGRKYYKIDYNLPRILEYILIALAIFVVRDKIFSKVSLLRDLLTGGVIVMYGIYIMYREELFRNKINRIWKLK